MSAAEDRVIDAEYRSLFYKLVSGAIRYPKLEVIEKLASQEFWDGLKVLLEATNRIDLCRELLNEETVIRKELEQGLVVFEVEYNRLFQLSQQFACPLTASEYMPGESRQATAVAQLKGLYKAFGLQTRPSTEADHLSVLLEFMSFLCAKEAHALNKDEEDEAAQCIKARTIVLEDFLGWLPLFLSTVKLNCQLKFYPWIASLLTEFLRNERKLLLSASKEDL